MRASNFLFSILCLALSFQLGCSTAEKGDLNTPEGAFASAEALEKDDRYEEAIARYAEVKNKHPYSRFATMSELKIADVHFKREAFIEAQGAYQLFKEFHPKHPQSDYVTYRLAMSYFNQLPTSIDRDLSAADKAILYFDEVATSYPSSTHVTESKEKKAAALKMLGEKEMYVARFYYKQKKFDSAMKRYEFLLKTYPNLGFDPEALLGAANSASKSGERERALQHVRTLNAKFPQTDEAQRAKNEFGDAR